MENIKNKRIKLNIVKIILIVLIIGVFGLIFGFSSQNVTESRGISRQVTEFLTKNIKSIQEKPEKEKEAIIKKINHFIRKLAHFCIYTILGILLMGLLKTCKMKDLTRGVITFLIGALYATSDEIHQMFSPGRGPQVSDVILDSAGVLLGILIVMLITKIYKKIKNKKEIKKVIA